MPFRPDPLRPGPLHQAQDMQRYVQNPHLETPYNPITARDTIGQPIRDQVFERGTTGQPILESRVTGRTITGHPITFPVSDITRTPTYGADNIISQAGFQKLKRDEEIEKYPLDYYNNK